MADDGGMERIYLNPFTIVILLFTFVIVLNVVAYFMGTFIINVPNPFLPNTFGNAIVDNFTLPKTIYISAFNTVNSGMVIAVLFAMVADVVISYYKPSKGQGIFGILMIFIMPMIWLALKIGLIDSVSHINSAIAASGVTSTLYSFYVSPYFIFVAEVFLVISVILNFRHEQRSIAEGDFDSDIRTRA